MRADLEVFLAGEPQVGEPDTQVFAGGHAILGVQIAAGGRQLQSAAIGAQTQIRVALLEGRARAREPVRQADAAALAVEQGAGARVREIEIQRARGANGGGRMART